MFTSNFARVKTLPEHLTPVSIARFPPRWYGSRKRYIALAPTKAMLKMPQSEYDLLYADILSKLNPRQVFDALGENAVLLCWEAPGDICHRRWAAEWLEQALGIEIPEYGFERQQTPSYAAMVQAATGSVAVPTVSTYQPLGGSTQKLMF